MTGKLLWIREACDGLLKLGQKDMLQQVVVVEQKYYG